MQFLRLVYTLVSQSSNSLKTYSALGGATIWLPGRKEVTGHLDLQIPDELFSNLAQCSFHRMIESEYAAISKGIICRYQRPFPGMNLTYQDSYL